jgi:Matrixin
MRHILRISVLLAILLLSIHTTESYVRSRLNVGPPLAWNLVNPSTPIVSNGRVTYSIDSAGSDDVPFSEVEQALDRSFQAWENVPTSVISFQRGPNITSDKSNLPGVFDLFWVEDSTIVPVGDEEIDISGALAVTFTLSSINNGEILDLFIVFNGNEVTWATDGNPVAFDIQQVATHEIGHAIGISHSPHAASTMFPRTGPGRIRARSPRSYTRRRSSPQRPEISPGVCGITMALQSSGRTSEL